MERVLTLARNKKTKIGRKPTITPLKGIAPAIPVRETPLSARTPAVPPVAAAAATPKTTTAVVDYPREGETINSALYTFRIGAAPEAYAVEISIDGGSWKPCRRAVGYWWYDWAGYGDGAYQVRVRAQTPEGPTAASRPRAFRVETDGRNTFSVN